MNELIRIEEKNGIQSVNARELYYSLGVGRDFPTWIQERIGKYGFVEGQDFSPEMGESTGGRPSIEYRLSVNMAKEIAMVENNDKGREIRQYLIKVEQAWNLPEMVMARALQLADKTVKSLQSKIQADAPKIESFDSLQRSERSMSITAAAKHFGVHPKTEVFPYLRERGYLTAKDLPTQAALDAGYLATREAEGTDGVFRPVACVLACQLETWRTRIIPQIAAWKAEE